MVLEKQTMDPAKREFEKWMPGAHIGDDLKVKGSGAVNVEYYVLADLAQAGNKTILLEDYTRATQVLHVEHINTRKEYIAKVIYDAPYNSEVKNQLDICRLALGKLPNIIKTVGTASTVSSNKVCRVLLMERGHRFNPHYKLVRKSAKTKQMVADFHLSLVFQILYALHFLHFHCYQHRDIRQENMVFEMVDEDMGQYENETYQLGEYVFSVPVKFNSFWCIPKFIDFGLSVNLANDEDQGNITAYVAVHRPPDLVFSDGLRRLEIRNNDELFALGMCLFYMIYPLFELGELKDLLFKKLCALVEDLKANELYELYHQYTTEETAYHAIALVLLMGFPPFEYRPFYTSAVGGMLFSFEEEIRSHPHYDLMARTKPATYLGQHGELMKILRKVIRWERSRRPLSAGHLLQNPILFGRFRVASSTTAQWNATLGH